MNHYLKFFGLNVAISIFVSFASEQIPALDREKTRLPVIVAGEAVKAAKSPRLDAPLVPRLNPVIAEAREQVKVRNKFDRNCTECILIEKNKILFSNEKLINYLSCLACFDTMPQSKVEQAVNLFKGNRFHKIPTAVIEQACLLWSCKPNKLCVSHKKQEIALRKLLAKKTF